MAIEGLDQVATQLAVLKAVSEERFTALDASTKLALTNNDERMKLLNEWRSTYGDLVTNVLAKVSAVSEAISTLRSQYSDLQKQNEALRIQIIEQNRPNYVLVVTSLVALATLIGGMWTVVDLKITGDINPLVQTQEQMRSVQKQHDGQINEIITALHKLGEENQTSKVIENQYLEAHRELVDRVIRAELSDKEIRTQLEDVRSKQIHVLDWIDAHKQ